MLDNPARYTATMVDAPGLNAAERSAAELRFRMALEDGVGGREFVVPTLQACILARSLISHLPPGEQASTSHAAEREVIALWESAEDRAIMTALKPLNRDTGEARFEINF